MPSNHYPTRPYSYTSPSSYLSSSSSSSPAPPRRKPTSTSAPLPSTAERLLDLGAGYAAKKINKHVPLLQSTLNEAYRSHQNALKNGVDLSYLGSKAHVRVNERDSSFNATLSRGSDRAEVRLAPQSRSFTTHSSSHGHSDRREVRHERSRGKESLSYLDDHTRRDGYSHIGGNISSTPRATAVSTSVHDRYGDDRFSGGVAYGRSKRKESLGYDFAASKGDRSASDSFQRTRRRDK